MNRKARIAALLLAASMLISCTTSDLYTTSLALDAASRVTHTAAFLLDVHRPPRRPLPPPRPPRPTPPHYHRPPVWW